MSRTASVRRERTSVTRISKAVGDANYLTAFFACAGLAHADPSYEEKEWVQRTGPPYLDATGRRCGTRIRFPIEIVFGRLRQHGLRNRATTDAIAARR